MKTNEKKFYVIDCYKNGVNRIVRIPKGKNLIELSFYKNGHLKSEGSYVNGKKEGVWKYYYDTGHLKSEGSYVNGKMDGVWKFYNGHGKVYLEESYVDDKKNGVWKCYHRNGNLEAEGFYVDGKKNGLWKFYHKSGNFSSENFYIMDFKVSQEEWNDFLVIKEEHDAWISEYLENLEKL